MHIYGSVCAHMCSYIGKWGKVHVICVWTPEVDIMCLLLHSIFFFETEGLCFETNLKLHDWIDWLTNKPLGSSYVYLPLVGLQADISHSTFYRWRESKLTSLWKYFALWAITPAPVYIFTYPVSWVAGYFQ